MVIVMNRKERVRELKDLFVWSNNALVNLEGFEKALDGHYEKTKSEVIWDMKEEVQAMAIKALHIKRRMETIINNEKVSEMISRELKER